MFLIIHYDEIGLKKGNREFFEKILVSNLTDLGVNGMKRERGQIVGKADFSEELVKRISLTPGVSNFVFCEKSSFDLEDIKKLSVQIFKSIDSKGKTFKIDTKRHNKSFNIDSPTLNDEIGGEIIATFGCKVKLNNPDITLTIEICEKEAYIGLKRYEGIGGMPVGSAGKMLCLLSGGIDSPVAAFMMMKRGVNVDFIHFQNKTQMTKSTQKKIEQIVDRLKTIQGESKLYIVPFNDIQKEIIMNINSKYRMIVYRRYMMRIAEQIAKRDKHMALITGDSLCQVASQTVENLCNIYNSTDMVILSPLIGMNKMEIVAISKKIGTYEISILPYGDCCSFFVAKNPKLRSRESDLEKIETTLDKEKLINQAISETTII